MSKGLLAILGGMGPKDESEDDRSDDKTVAAEDALQAIKDEDAEAFADAIEALIKLHRVRRMRSEEE